MRLCRKASPPCGRWAPTDKRLARFSDHVLLLRPDRYVAACVPVDDLDQGAAAVERLVEGTFE